MTGKYNTVINTYNRRISKLNKRIAEWMNHIIIPLQMME
jgi:hypothetical protein